MTVNELSSMLTSRAVEAGTAADCEVQLRHDRELFVFNQEGQMVGESIVLERGPKPCSD